MFLLAITPGSQVEHVETKVSRQLVMTQCYTPSGGDLNPGLPSTSILLLQNADSFAIGLAGTQHNSLLFTEYVCLSCLSCVEFHSLKAQKEK